MILKKTTWIGIAFIAFISSLSWSINVNKITQKDLKYYREKARSMFDHAYNGYLNHAYPYDELQPLTCDGHDTWGSFSLTLVDALDTLAVMGNCSEFRRISKLVEKIDFSMDINASVFETNIRVVGGLLSAHLLSHHCGSELEDGWPCSGPLLRLAENVARRLLPAFDTHTGMPYGTVNLRHGVPQGETTITCTAGVGTFIIEFGTLSRLTGDPIFENVALRALDALWMTRSEIGLVGNHVDVKTGKWTALDTGIGSGVDSYFEYLVKGSMLFTNPHLLSMFKESLKQIEKYVKQDDWYLWVGMKKGTVTLPVFQSLEAFWPGLQSLVGDIDKAMKTIHNYHQVWKQYGAVPEFYNIPKGEVHGGREGYPLRPELAESVMYLYRATKDPFLIEVAVDILESIEATARTSCGYATVKNVDNLTLDNRMESFFLAETMKYLYLTFDTENFIHNDGKKGTVLSTPNGDCIIGAGGYIFNTEAHPIDPGAVHCCSAAKKQSDHIIQQFHDDLDLLSLLSIMDDKSDNFIQDKYGDADDSNSQLLDEAVDNSIPSEINDESLTAPSSEIKDGSDIETEDATLNLHVSNDENVLKVNLPSTLDKSSTEKKTLKKVEPDLFLGFRTKWHPKMSNNYSILTCPVQPFHSRVSIMGEMFSDN